MLPNEFQCSNCLGCRHVKTLQVTAKVTRMLVLMISSILPSRISWFVAIFRVLTLLLSIQVPGILHSASDKPWTTRRKAVSVVAPTPFAHTVMERALKLHLFLQYISILSRVELETLATRTPNTNQRLFTILEQVPSFHQSLSDQNPKIRSQIRVPGQG